MKNVGLAVRLRGALFLATLTTVMETAMADECKAVERSAISTRREKLWSLLGDLPRQHQCASAQLIKSERIGSGPSGFTLEHLRLDLNGLEPVPAVLLIPNVRKDRSAGMLYMHWHGGDYSLGKKELLVGNRG